MTIRAKDLETHDATRPANPTWGLDFSMSIALVLLCMLLTAVAVGMIGLLFFLATDMVPPPYPLIAMGGAAAARSRVDVVLPGARVYSRGAACWCCTCGNWSWGGPVSSVWYIRGRNRTGYGAGIPHRSHGHPGSVRWRHCRLFRNTSFLPAVLCRSVRELVQGAAPSACRARITAPGHDEARPPRR